MNGSGLTSRGFLIALAGIALAGCSSPVQPIAAPTPQASAQHTSPTPSRTPTITDDWTACQGGVPFYTASPAYAGPGPHRVLGFNLGNSIDAPAAAFDSKIVPPDDPQFFPDSWVADHEDALSGVFVDVPEQADYRHAQLALCMSPPEDTGRKVGTCSYSAEDDPSAAARASRSTWSPPPMISNCSRPGLDASWHHSG